MTIIWIGTDDTDFYKTPKLSSSSSNYFRSAFSRAAYGSNEFDAQFLFSKKFIPVTSAWFSLLFGTGSIGGMLQNLTNTLFSFSDFATGKCIGLGIGSISGVPAIIINNGSSNTILKQESDGSLTRGFFNITKAYRFDIQLINYGENGTINCFLNGRLIITYTGDLRISGISSFDTICIGPYHSSLHIQTFQSELIVADEDTRTLSVKTLVPNAVGDVNEWSGAYTTIDEIFADSTDKITANADDLLFLTNMTGMPSLNRSYKVKAVKVAARFDPAYSDLGAKIGIKTNSAVHLGNVEEHGRRITIEKIYHNNPETGIAFTPAEVDALQLALYSTTLD